MAYGLHANGEAFNDLLTDIDELLLNFIAQHPAAAVSMFVQAHQPAGLAADGREMVDNSTGIGLWDVKSTPGDSWREGATATQASEPVDSKPNSRAARRRAARG